MMVQFDSKMKCLVALSERIQGFLNDGYQRMFDYHDNSMVCWKLRHRNGKIIFLKLNLINGVLTQCTNGKQTHTEKVC